MQDQLDFTYDPVRYKDMPALVNEVHSYGQKYIIILVRDLLCLPQLCNGAYH